MATLEVSVVEPWETWGQAVRTRLPSADKTAIMMEIGLACQEFTTNSLCLLEDLEVVLQEDISTYDLSPVVTEPVLEDNPTLDIVWSGVRALYVHQFKSDSGYIYPKPISVKPRFVQSTSGTVLGGWCPRPAVVEFLPTPDANMAGKSIFVVTSLAVNYPNDYQPVILRDYYFDGIMDGALGRMMSHPKRPYSDSSLAQYHMRRFRNAMRVAKDEAIRRWSSAEALWSFSRDWSSHNQKRTN